jgi:methionine synthase I (cobalamin-dependent)/5,10-methylenetetrahydrofolate reductase
MSSTSRSASFLEQLGTAPVVTDGSMATELGRRGQTEAPPALYNLKNPVLVETIHRDFVDAGATLVQANTEQANRIALERYNLADKVYEINRKGVWIARCAALHRAIVAGVVGPLGRFMAPLGKIRPQDARQAFIDQIIALVDGGADILMLKSFIDIEELELAIEAARFVDPSIPVIAQKTFPEDGSVLATSFPREMARRLVDKGVDVIGANGTVGPQRMLDIIRALRIDGVPIISQPDIGIPTLVDGKAIFNAEPEYVARSIRAIVEAGAAIIGADGGATVEHIRAIAAAVSSAVVGGAPATVRKEKNIVRDDEQPLQNSMFYQNLGKKFLTAVELDIPRGLDLAGVLDGARYLKEHGIDAVNISDGARARLRMNAITISHLVQAQTGIECLCHLACRDRNMVGLQSDLLGAYALGVNNILAVTGDPAQIGDYPYATSVYDIDSIGLVRALHRMNHGEDLAGNPIGRRTHFCIACACNPIADDMEREVARLEQKAAEGAHVVFSQPVFEMETLEKFLDKIRHIDIHFMLGIIPLRSIRHAEFLHYEVPGMTVPERVRECMRAADTSPDESMNEGIRIAVEFLREARPHVAGAYLMPPFKKYDMAVEILRQIS